MSEHRRASDADRDLVVEELQTATVDGRLDGSEFEERLTAAYAATTHAQLAPLTADLGPTAGLPTVHRDELTLRAHSAVVRRDGRWKAPRRIVVDAHAGRVHLDLIDAVLPGPRLDIILRATSTTFRIVVPPGAVVDHDDLEMESSTWRLQVAESTAPGPYVRIAGRARTASLVVRDRRGWLAERRGRRRRLRAT